MELVDYSKYLSVDNKKGLLFNKDDILVLNKYGFDYKKYDDLKVLIREIDEYLNDCYISSSDLEEVLIRLSEIYYYNYVNK